MQRIHLLLIGATLWLLLRFAYPDPAQAQNATDSTVVMPEIVVIDSSGIGQTRSASFRTVLSSGQMRTRPGESVADILESESLLLITRAGPTGLATASLRGFGSAHTSIELDGLRLSNPQTGQIDLSLLPLSMLESIVVDHGAGSGEQGALGGTVSLRTTIPSSSRTVRSRVGLGPWGHRDGGFAVSGPVAGVRGLASFDLAREIGAFSFPDPVATSPAVLRREGADRVSASIFGRTDGRFTGGTWYLAAWWMNVQRGVPGPSNAPPISARQTDDQRRIWGSARIQIPSGSVDIAFSNEQSSTRFQHPILRYSTTSRTHSLTMKTSIQRVLSEEFAGGLLVRWNRNRTRLSGGHRESLLTAQAFGNWTVGPLVVDPKLDLVRYASGDRNYTRFLPRFSALLSLLKKPRLEVHGNGARIFRTPTFNERYWLPGGNPALVPEEGLSGDIGVSVETSVDRWSSRLEATIYRSRLSDRIIWHPGLAAPSLQVWRPSNLGLVVAGGLEVAWTARYRLGEELVAGVRLLHTRTRVEDQTDRITRSFRKQLRYTPEYASRVILTMDSRGTGASLIINRIDRRSITSDETRFLSAYSTVSIRMFAGLNMSGGRLDLSIAIQNATNAEFEQIRFYPTPPRHVRLAIMFSGKKTR